MALTLKKRIGSPPTLVTICPYTIPANHTDNNSNDLPVAQKAWWDAGFWVPCIAASYLPWQAAAAWRQTAWRHPPCPGWTTCGSLRPSWDQDGAALWCLSDRESPAHPSWQSPVTARWGSSQQCSHAPTCACVHLCDADGSTSGPLIRANVLYLRRW